MTCYDTHVKDFVKGGIAVDNNLGSNVSRVTVLCESAMETDSDISAIAPAVAAFKDNERILAFRGLLIHDIKKVLCDWKNELNLFVREKTETDNFVIVAGNSLGNSASSDLVVFVDGESVMNIEAKFGFATNGAYGIRRVSSVLGVPAFNLHKEQKAALLTRYHRHGPSYSLSMLQDYMNEYVHDFNVSSHIAVSGKVFDMVKSSGKAGNGSLVKDYRILNFRRKTVNDFPTGIISESSLNITKNDVWNIECSVTNNDESQRLSYFLRSQDGQKRIKIMFNNKNSLYAIEDKETGMLKSVNKRKYDINDLTQIQSKFQMGTASYNMWYREGLEE